MKAVGAQRLLQAASCALCASVAWKYSLGLAETEFGGGTLTGPLLALHSSGVFLFILALLLTFAYPKVAAMGTLLASLLCWPLYLYFTAPGPFRHVFPGEYSVPAQASFVWDGWAIVGMLGLVVTTYVCLRTLLVKRLRSSDGV